MPWLHGSLEPKLRELIYIAIDVSTTHLYERGTRVHLRNAIQYGATFNELLDVMVVTSLLGLQSSVMSIPEVAAAVQDQLGRENGLGTAADLSDPQGHVSS